MDATPAAEPQHSHHRDQQSSNNSGGPQVRSRITVVCAECKRLKLKCDRRTPCGSCTKRDTVARCVYSAAATEKVDLHSLNNRLIQVESQIAQMGAPGARPTNFQHGFGFAPRPDRSLLATSQSGSSLVISLDDTAAIWLGDLEINREMIPTQQSSSHSPTSAQIKLEPVPVSLPPPDSAGADVPIPILLPSMSVYYSSHSPSFADHPTVTPSLVAHIPLSLRRRQKMYESLEELLKMHPCFNWKHFKDRSESMFKWASESDDVGGASFGEGRSGSVATTPTTKADLARAIFFGTSSGPCAQRAPAAQRPPISFFAAASAAFALGGLLDKSADEQAESLRSDPVVGDPIDELTGRPTQRKKTAAPTATVKRNGKIISKDTASAPAVLFALSQQALTVFENSNTYDLDYLVAMILQVLYVLHEGKARLAHNLLPDVGKMVNVARTMGLDSDPDDFPGKFTLFEAELRRRVWWDIYYYDLFISDYMGRAPLINDHECSTRLPMDVDEELFNPSCGALPLPRTSQSALEPNASDFKYFRLKCSLAQLVKDVKKQSFRDPDCEDQLLLDQAMACEDDIKQWLADLPPAFRLDMERLRDKAGCSSLSSELATLSPVLVAQRCELAITANRLILKVYLPFLRPSYPYGSVGSHHQAALGTINAAHAIIHSAHVLYATWKQRSDPRCRRPSPALFDFYAFRRTLFDAAVVCSHAVITQPSAIWANVTLDDVSVALEIMRDPLAATGRGSMQGGVEDTVNEAVKIVELLRQKALAARSGNPEYTTGMKRKHDDGDVDTDPLLTGFNFPYVGVGVVSAGPSVASDPGHSQRQTPAPVHAVDLSLVSEPPVPIPEIKRAPSELAAPPAKRPANVVTAEPQKHKEKKEKEKGKDKDKSKKVTYPAWGVRARPTKEVSPLTRTRPSSSSTKGSTPVIPTQAELSSSQASSYSASPAVDDNRFSVQSVTPNQASFTMGPPNPVPTEPSQHHGSAESQHVDYSDPYNSAAATMRAYSDTSAQPSPLYEHHQSGQFSETPLPAPYNQPMHGDTFSQSNNQSYGVGPMPPMQYANVDRRGSAYPSTNPGSQMVGSYGGNYEDRNGHEAGAHVSLGIDPSMAMRGNDMGTPYVDHQPPEDSRGSAYPESVPATPTWAHAPHPPQAAAHGYWNPQQYGAY